MWLFNWIAFGNLLCAHDESFDYFVATCEPKSKCQQIYGWDSQFEPQKSASFWHALKRWKIPHIQISMSNFSSKLQNYSNAQILYSMKQLFSTLWNGQHSTIFFRLFKFWFAVELVNFACQHINFNNCNCTTRNKKNDGRWCQVSRMSPK